MLVILLPILNKWVILYKPLIMWDFGKITHLSEKVDLERFRTSSELFGLTQTPRMLLLMPMNIQNCFSESNGFYIVLGTL